MSTKDFKRHKNLCSVRGVVLTALGGITVRVWRGVSSRFEMRSRQSPSFLALLLLLFLLFSALLPLHTVAMYTIGVNYGQLGDNLPPPHRAVELIKEMKIGKVKIYDANPAILKELANTDIKVCVMLPNEQIVAVANNMTLAEMFVRINISVFYPSTKIRTLLVGNEILSASNQTWPYLVPAMINLHKALRKYRLRKIKVSTPLAMDMLRGPLFPPSNASFRSDIADSVMKPLLSFLHHTKAPLFVDVYPFFARENDATNISLGFALFTPNANIYKDCNGLVYNNLLDVQLDAVLAAIAKTGFSDVEITISETGWPTREDLDERGASAHNAALYNRRLVKRVLANPSLGTPYQPGKLIDTYIFALFNENLKGGPTTERNWGLLYPNGTRVYDIDLTGYLNETIYRILPASPVEAPPGQRKVWCIANPHADAATLGGALSYACGQGSVDCKDIQPWQPCFLPNSTLSHASYAFNNYYNQFHKSGGTCIFGGAANLTTQDPSHGSCVFSPTYV